MKIKMYGCRGTIAVSRPDSRYGGNTSCMTVESGGELLVIDAGSGLMMLQKDLATRFAGDSAKPVNILLSHLHLDHIIGLGAFEPAWKQGVCVYTCSRDERPLMQQVFGVFSPPYWPVSMVENVKTNKCVPIEADKPFDIGAFTITPFFASHPDMTLSYHISDGKKNFIHLLDSETEKMAQSEPERMQKYCSGADLIVFDAAYSPEDYPKHQGWGHSTVEHGAKLARQWGCKYMIFAHFGYQYEDEDLYKWRSNYLKDGGDFIFARDGLELDL